MHHAVIHPVTQRYVFVETIFWIELRYEEGGRYVIVSRAKGSSENIDWTPKDMNARTLVHEYGGMSIQQLYVLLACILGGCFKIILLHFFAC